MGDVPILQAHDDRRPTPERYAAFIGTRRLNTLKPDAIWLFQAEVRHAVRNGLRIRTGAAKGADQLAAETAWREGGGVTLVLPWPGYEAYWRAGCEDYDHDVWVYDPVLDRDWTASVHKYHPYPYGLTDAGRALHARNYGIVAGADFVVALVAPDRKGGTEQGIRIALALEIPVRVIVEESSIDVAGIHPSLSSKPALSPN